VIVPVAGRTVRGTRHLVGWFAHNIPLMTDPDLETLPELARAVAGGVVAAMRHDVPITPLAVELRPLDITPVPRHPYLYFDATDNRRRNGSATGPAAPLTPVRTSSYTRRRLQPGISVNVTVDESGPRVFTAHYGTGQYRAEVVGALADAGVARWTDAG
jgi:hypothetical protein